MAQERLRYDTLLLDFHGTFTSHRGRSAHALNIAFCEVTRRNITKEEFLIISNRNPEENAADAINKALNGTISEIAKNKLVQVYRFQQNNIYIPKHLYLIKALHDLGALCAVVTNGEELVVREILQAWKASQYVTEIYGRGAEGILGKMSIPKKPSPQVLDFVIDDLKGRGHLVRRNKILMVGDYKDDIEAGNSSGLHTAFLVTGPNQMPEYYNMRPTYTFLDSLSLKPSASEWLKRENVYSIRDLPKIVSGEI